MPPKTNNSHLLRLSERLVKVQRIWAVAFALMSWITISTIGGEYPLAAASWLLIAILLLVGKQPAYFALVAAQWGLSLLSLFPGLNRFIGPDPFAMIFKPGLVEGLVLAMLRILLLLVAWHQFLTFRILYGRPRIQQRKKSLQELPEIIPNQTALMATVALVLAFLANLSAWGTVLLNSPIAIAHLGSSSYLFASFAIGLGLGASFSPTRNPGVAGTSIAFGAIALLSMLIVQRYFIH